MIGAVQVKLAVKMDSIAAIVARLKADAIQLHNEAKELDSQLERGLECSERASLGVTFAKAVDMADDIQAAALEAAALLEALDEELSRIRKGCEPLTV